MFKPDHGIKVKEAEMMDNRVEKAVENEGDIDSYRRALETVLKDLKKRLEELKIWDKSKMPRLQHY